MSTEAPATGSKKKKIIIIAAIAVVALLLVGVAMFFIFNKQEEQRQVINGVETPAPPAEAAHGEAGHGEAAAAIPGAPSFTDAEMFTSNLGDAQGIYFIQVGVIFEVTNKGAVDPIIKPVMPIIRSQILLLLGTKSSTELRSIDGKRLLADQILEIARRAVGVSNRDKIIAVHFTNFVIQ